jgi:hypothetical protein
LGAIVAHVMAAGSTTAAEIELLDLPGDFDIVSIKGEIIDGDSDRFYEIVNHRDRVTVALQSPGGLVKEALQIGAEIRMKNFATMVTSDGECSRPVASSGCQAHAATCRRVQRSVSMPPTGKRTAKNPVWRMQRSDPS